MSRSHRFQVGSIDCIVVADGTSDYTADLMFARAPRGRRDDALRAHGLKPEVITAHLNCLVIRSAGRTALVDTGLGPGVSRTAGLLMSSLRGCGMTAANLDVVFLTHAHPDHIGGNLPGGKTPWSNARFAMARREWEFWTSEATRQRLAAAQLYGVPDLDGFIGGWIAAHLSPLAATIDLLDGDREIVPGVRMVPASGHTPGHTMLEISSGGQTVLAAVDTFLTPLHVKEPEWAPIFDLDPSAAAATRRATAGRLAANRTLFLSYHFPFPGLGYVEQRGAGWEWQPA
jgi:glyoxylase-like metal-dependent hydrolase (beta-lactamase superfamily II)